MTFRELYNAFLSWDKNTMLTCMIAKQDCNIKTYTHAVANICLHKYGNLEVAYFDTDYTVVLWES